ncbi:LAME_0G02080g1_1 [Lachancea meyersii CBS 8951]|uniref:SUN-like protein 1 n=1 Tax=Lachancea meyersii CBS 8951 TaxID=1266667 RepID=A0A1G4K5R0_9SACH|nr:LAME_0G02080g1_1 [Lachancea meyersii CBS 8951]
MRIHYRLSEIVGLLSVASCFDSISSGFDLATETSLTLSTIPSGERVYHSSGTQDVESTTDLSKLLSEHFETSIIHSISATSVQSQTNQISCESTVSNDKTQSTDSSPTVSAPSSCSVQASRSALLQTEDLELNESDTTFLSFDEWKKIKLSQDSGREVQPISKPISRPDLSIYRGETIGDDLEIDVDLFTSHTSSANDEPEGKLYKDRFNYASLDCAATIVKTNSEASGANAILHENKDKYLLTPCSASNKFVVIELCQDILVEQIVIANYEFFSSTFQTLRFAVADRFPPKTGWKVLGEVNANNTRNVQKFDISNPLIWARYVRVEVLSHYGNEFYCPISVIRVHGKTMMDDVKLDELEVRYSQKEEIARSVEKKTEECLKEEMAILSLTGKVLDKCQFPDFRSNENLTAIPDLELAGSQCPTSLPYLEFDQFLRNFNHSTCDPAKFQSALDMPSSMPSSSAEESIFKTMMKRLSQLESNSTLSLRYIEEQSKLVSRAFTNLEKNQEKKFDTLVEALNQTILSNLGELSVFSQQLRDSSLKVLDEQKQLNDQLVSETLSRLESVKKDAIFQRRLSYTMLFAFATLLVYVLLSKEAYVDETMVDDGWYINSPQLQKAKDKILIKTGNRKKLNKPLVFEAGRGNSGDYKSDVSASTSSASLYDEFVSEHLDSPEPSGVELTESFDEESMIIESDISTPKAS